VSVIIVIVISKNKFGYFCKTESGIFQIEIAAAPVGATGNESRGSKNRALLDETFTVSESFHIIP